MTHHIPPEDAFDQWLDDLSDGNRQRSDDASTESAAWLHDHFGLPPVAGTRLTARDRERIRSRVMPSPASKPAKNRSAGATGIVANPAPIAPAGPGRTGLRLASLAAAAVLVLIALATIGAVLRMGDDEQAPGIAATASMMPFAPASALASPTPMANCATDDTLLLTPEEPVEAGSFVDLPFPVAWYEDGVLAVERDGEVVREIEIGKADTLRTTSIPGVVFATTGGPNPTGTFVNIASGDMFEAGQYQRIDFSEGPFVFWASDTSFMRWHVTDLRTFETADLSQRFTASPLKPWLPYTTPMTTSEEGTVLLVGTTTYDPSNQTVTPATPVASDGPELHISRDALLVNGSLADISVVGPIAPSSGDMALSPDGRTMAWLAPSEQGGERILTIADTATGDVISERPVEATYSNSLLFSADGLLLYATSGTTLERVVVHPDRATPAATEPIILPDTAYRILAASPDRTKLLLSRTQHAAGEVSIWLDLDSGDMREFEGTLGRLWESTFPSSIAPAINSHVLIDDLIDEVSILDMETGEIVTGVDRQDGAALTTIAADGSTLLIPHEGSVDLLDLSTGSTTTHPAPEGAEGFPQLAVSPDGSCAVVSWRLESEDRESALLSASSDTQTPLPPAEIGGWVPREDG